MSKVNHYKTAKYIIRFDDLCSEARELLGYDPEYDFAKGLNEAITWHKENL